MSRRAQLPDACDAARAHASRAHPAIARRWEALALRLEELRRKLAEAEDDEEALRAELDRRIQAYVNADRGKDLIASLGDVPDDER